jgi:acyl-CoA thioester hydrolase
MLKTDRWALFSFKLYGRFEAGRTDFLKKAGFSNTSIETKGVLLPLYGMNCQYKSPARYEDEIMVVTSLKQVSRVRLCFSYQVLNTADNKLLATGETMHAWTDTALKPVDAKKRFRMFILC